MKVFKMSVTIQFIEGLLGTLPSNPEIYREFKQPEDDEMDHLPELSEDDPKGVTVFPRTEDDTPFIYDYQLKGLFKEKCAFLRGVAGKDDESAASKGGPNLSSGFAAFKKKIDGLFFIEDRVNPIILPEGTEITLCQRPLRAETAKGPRVSLACSEEIPAGSTCSFTVVVFNKKHIDLVKEWLEFGAVHGTGQWRNSGKGRFVADFGEIEEGEWDYEDYKAHAKRALKDLGIAWGLSEVEKAQTEPAPKRGRKKAAVEE